MEKKDGEPRRLAREGGNSRPGDSHAESKDQKGVQHDIQDAAGHHADHGKRGPTLGAQVAVQDGRSTQDGSARKNKPGVAFCIGGNGGGCAQKADKPIQKQKSRRPNHRPCHQSRKKRSGSRFFGQSGFLFP